MGPLEAWRPRPRAPVDYEASLSHQIALAGLPAPVAQYRFAPPRRFRFDLCWPERLIAVEVQGGIWVQGRHSRGSGVMGDCEKACLAAILGWRILPIPTEWVADRRGVPDGRALALVQRILTAEGVGDGRPRRPGLQ